MATARRLDASLAHGSRLRGTAESNSRRLRHEGSTTRPSRVNDRIEKGLHILPEYPAGSAVLCPAIPRALQNVQQAADPDPSVTHLRPSPVPTRIGGFRDRRAAIGPPAEAICRYPSSAIDSTKRTRSTCLEMCSFW